MLTDGEIKFYQEKGMHLPKRCKECRDKNKNVKQSSGFLAKLDRMLPDSTYRNRHEKMQNFLPLLLVFLFMLGIAFGLAEFFYKPGASDTQNDIRQETVQESGLSFRSSDLLSEHYSKHGTEVGALSQSDYVEKANNVVNTADKHKTEAEDGDDVYFKSSTGEIVFVSDDGFIRTYFVADQAYFDRQ